MDRSCGVPYRVCPLVRPPIGCWRKGVARDELQGWRTLQVARSFLSDSFDTWRRLGSSPQVCPGRKGGWGGRTRGGDELEDKQRTSISGARRGKKKRRRRRRRSPLLLAAELLLLV